MVSESEEAYEILNRHDHEVSEWMREHDWKAEALEAAARAEYKESLLET